MTHCLTNCLRAQNTVTIAKKHSIDRMTLSHYLKAAEKDQRMLIWATAFTNPGTPCTI